MTREKAIKIIKEFISGTCLHLVDQEALETLIPELKETEDERVIKLIRSLLENVRNVQSNTSLYKQYDDALAWLEKQKDSVSNAKYIEDVAHAFEDGRKKGIKEKQKECLADNSKTSASEDERIRKWLVNHFRQLSCQEVGGIAVDDIITYLEKQKEEEGYEAIPVESTLEYKLGFKAGKESEKQKKKFEDISTVLLVKKEIERRIETWQKSRKEALAMECNTLADDAAVRIEELHSLISFLGTIRCGANEKQKESDESADEDGDFTIYHPLKNGEGRYECIPYSFYGSLTSFSDDKDLMDFLNESFYDKEECERWCERENIPDLPECKHKIKKDSVFDYLCDNEKQKEQKPVKWNDEYREEDLQTRFAFYTYKDDSSVLYLSNVFVEESSRNHGFGTRILKAAEKAAEAIGATTICLKVKQDSPANAWYRKRGYGYVAFEDGYDWLEKNLEYMKPNKPVEKPDLVAELKHHLATTPKEQLEKEWKELERWNNIGPTVQEFLYGKPVECRDCALFLDGKCQKPGGECAKKEKPVEWSEEDETAFDNALSGLKYAYEDLINHKSFDSAEDVKNAFAWLKSLRPQKLDASKLKNFDPVDVLNRIKTEWPMAWEKVVGKQE